ncbi:MAG TPA: heme peroxidase family protein [Chthoniobacterales bacterium]|nr:heme peroxidase family protein [Chthoniobacterales bacterium]
MNNLLMNNATYYTRMFPQLERLPSMPNSKHEIGLQELGLIMKDDNEESGDSEVASGATYLGQFIDHDLTLDLTPLDYAHVGPDRTPNHRTPFLDLDHLYGGGPNLSPFLYDMTGSPGAEHFLIGSTRKAMIGNSRLGPSADDLPRNRMGIALVGDPRQDENVIIAQLNLAFLKIHNLLLDLLIAEHPNGRVNRAGPVGGTLFEQARRLLIWHYQYVVFHEFLGTLVTPDVFAEVLKGRIAWAPRANKRFSIPLEFSVAGFRFGHSMVRDSYPYNDFHDDAKLGELLKQTGIGGGARPRLPADWVIKWSNFFPLEGIPRSARRINTQLAIGLHGLNPDTVKLYRAPVVKPAPNGSPPTSALSVRTLLRGARVGLPSGQDVAKAMRIQKPLTEDEVSQGLHRPTLIKYGFDRDTPLWYYVLKEAESSRLGSEAEPPKLGGEAEPPKLSGGAHLGPVGSRLVAGVIVGALLADPNSYLSIDPDWQPPVLDGQPRDSMSALLSLVVPASSA